MKLKKFLHYRILILFFLIILSVVWISPGKQDGVLIKDVSLNSSSFDAGITINTELKPKQRELITAIDSREIKNLSDYYEAISKYSENSTFRIITNKKEYPVYLNKELGLTVSEPPSSNLVEGLDLKGGTRVILTTEEPVSKEQFPDLIRIIEKRLNGFGIKDVSVRASGNEYIIVEIAGASETEVKKLVAQQGKFEAKINNETVFVGGKEDIVFVCKDDGTCAGIRDCQDTSQGSQCTFEFRIGLSDKAAKKHANITSKLDVQISPEGQEYLSSPLELYLDDNLMDTLQISSSLKGLEAKDIVISGPGFGNNEKDAIKNALKNMNNLQTILITGSLPVKLNIAKIDPISSLRGESLVKEALTAGFVALLMVALVIFIRYRKLKISIPMVIFSSSEFLMILGFFALIGYNLDLATIVGIIASVGTGVDDLIILTDEALKGSQISSLDWKTKIKKAFFVIMVAYFVTVAAMLPLIWTGAGLLTGFAIATIAGVTIGVFVARPAYAKFIEVLLHDE